MLAFTFLLFVLCVYYCESTNESLNELPENVFLYQCGPSTVVCYSGHMVNCSTLLNLQILLVKIKFESELGLDEYGISDCTINQNKSVLNGMTFSAEGVPTSGPTKEIEKFFVISGYTMYKYDDFYHKIDRCGCMIDPDGYKHYLYASHYTVNALSSLLGIQSDPYLSCSEYFAILKQRDPFAYWGRTPVILVPGFFASHINGRLNNVKLSDLPPDSSKCRRNVETYKIWLMEANMVRLVNLYCWITYITMTFNETTNRSQNFPGLETRVPEWGNTYGVEQFGLKGDQYFINIVSTLKDLGYEVGKNIRGAPYDFRKAPNEAEDYFEKLKTLVEETYELSDRRKVAFIAHSMGNMYTLYFLNNMTQEWKDKYIKSFVALAAPWSGSPLAVNLFVRGEVSDVPEFLVPPNELRSAQRTFPSGTFLLPNKRYWDSDDVLASFNGKEYSTANYEEFFEDLHLPHAWKMHLLTENLISELKSPGVPVYCVVAYGTPTPIRYDYGNIDVDGKVDKVNITFGIGDGLVTVHSANLCKRWKNDLKDMTYMNAQHKALLATRQLLGYIVKVLEGGFDV